MQKPRLLLLTIAASLLVTAATFEWIGRGYHYQPVSYDFVHRPDPIKQIHNFGPNRDSWAIEITYRGDRKREAGILTIYRDERTSSGAVKKFYEWDPANRDQIPPAKGYWGENSEFRKHRDEQLELIGREIESMTGHATNPKPSELKNKDEARYKPHLHPASGIVVGSHELSMMRAYALIANLDWDPDPEIFLVNESQPIKWRGGDLLFANDIRLGCGTFYVDYSNGQFKLKRYWWPGGFIAQTARRRSVDLFLVGFSFLVFLAALFPRNFPYRYKDLAACALIPAIGFYLVQHGFFLFVLMGHAEMALLILACAIAVIYFHVKKKFKAVPAS